MYKHLAINGELGSGKSSVARYLSKICNARLVSTGDVQRSIAASLNLSTLETNLRAEYDEMIDEQVDGVTRGLANSEESIIFDSRMAWQIVPTAFKVHLLVDPAVAARRLHGERSSAVEDYASVEEAKKAAEERYQSERRRFLAKYQADVSLLQNYHLVIDASDASVEEIAEEIKSEWAAAEETSKVSLRISPRRVLPGRDPRCKAYNEQPAVPSSEPVVAYARPFLYSLENQAVIAQAAQANKRLISASLLAEGLQEVEPGISAIEYLRTVIDTAWITEWETDHGFKFESYP
jgi:CMP/dCMP kinase